MPNCYVCNKGTPVTQFYLLRVYQDGEVYSWYYACGVSCLKTLVRDKTQGWSHFVLREYMTSCGRAWTFHSREELLDFTDRLT